VKAHDYHVNKKDYADAIFAYTKVIELNPTYAEAYENRERTYYHEGKYRLALIDCDKALN